MAYPGSSRGADYMRGFTWGVKGEATVMAELNRQIEGIKLRTEKGLVMAAAYALRDTEKVPPLTPVDTGNMRASRFITSASTVSTGALRGTGEGKFKGAKAAQMLIDYSMTIEEARAMVSSMNSSNRKFVMMGYTANYAGFVHEAIGMKNMSRGGSGPKWLEASLKRNTGKMVQIVKDNAEIKR